MADTWAGLPVRDGAADGLLCVFAPRNPDEFARVLAPGGRLVVVVPTPRHLRELRETHDLLGIDADKADAVAARFPGWRATSTVDEYQIALSADDASDLIAMGPNAFHGSPTGVSGGVATVSVSTVVLLRP